MRSSLLPGMLEAMAGNVARQQERVRLFEIGKSFHGSLDEHQEVLRIAAVASGPLQAEQWGSKAQPVDFFDIKSDVEAVLRIAGSDDGYEFEAASHPALQPGQAARIIRDRDEIGFIGKLHPNVAKAFSLKAGVFVFELDAGKALASRAPEAKTISKFPAIRRDISFFVDEKVTASDLVRAVESAAPDLIKSVRIFDIYEGPEIEAGLKSVAIGLILQETSRTLTDDDADAAHGRGGAKITTRIRCRIERLDSMALTKADMAESLFNELGLEQARSTRTGRHVF